MITNLMNFNSFLISVFIIFPSMLWADAPSALGFNFGSSLDRAPVAPFKKINYFNHESRYCLNKVISEEYSAPDKWNLKYTDNSIRGISRYNVGSNIFMGGRLAAYFFRINIFGSPRKICGVYFNNKLFIIYIDDGEFSTEEKELITNALIKKYGPPKTLIFSSSAVESWHVMQHKLGIEITTSIAGGMHYYYAPIKSKAMIFWENSKK